LAWKRGGFILPGGDNTTTEEERGKKKEGKTSYPRTPRKKDQEKKRLVGGCTRKEEGKWGRATLPIGFELGNEVYIARKRP